MPIVVFLKWPSNGYPSKSLFQGLLQTYLGCQSELEVRMVVAVLKMKNLVLVEHCLTPRTLVISTLLQLLVDMEVGLGINPVESP